MANVLYWDTDRTAGGPFDTQTGQRGTVCSAKGPSGSSCVSKYKSFHVSNTWGIPHERESTSDIADAQLFLINSVLHLGQVMQIFPFPRGTRTFCLQEGHV